MFDHNVVLTKEQFKTVCENVADALAKEFNLNENTDIIVDWAHNFITKIQQSDFLVIADEISKNLNKYWDEDKMKKLWEAKEVKLKHIYQVSDLIRTLTHSVRAINKLRVYARVGKGDTDKARDLCGNVVSEVRGGT